MIGFKICNSAKEMFEEDLTEIIEGYQKSAENTIQGKIAQFGKCDQDFYRKMYEELEKNSGFSFSYLIITDGERNIGVAIIEIAKQSHYDFKVAILNSVFILPQYRKFNAGKQLIEFASYQAKKQGAKAMYLTAPVGSRLERIYNRFYIKTDTVFLKEL